jgi:hypothetical protein
LLAEDLVVITLSMLSLGLALLLAAITVMNMVASHQPILQPAGGGTFGFDPTAFSPSDTMTHNYADNTLSEWHTADLHRLCDVESLLDTLEASHAAKTEVHFAGNDHFIVRWR